MKKILIVLICFLGLGTTTANAYNQDFVFYLSSGGTSDYSASNYKNDYDSYGVANTKYNDLVASDNVTYAIAKWTGNGYVHVTPAKRVYGNGYMNLYYNDGTTYGAYRNLGAYSAVNYANLSGTWAP